MSFVNELIPLNGPEREWLESFKLTYFNKPIVYNRYNSEGKLLAHKVWAIDHERKMCLLYLGGQGSYYPEGFPMTLIFIRDNKIASKIYARLDGSGNYDVGIKLNWILEEINILEQFKNNERETMNFILEGIDALGNLTKNRDRVLEVHFDKVAKPIYVRRIEL